MTYLILTLAQFTAPVNAHLSLSLARNLTRLPVEMFNKLIVRKTIRRLYPDKQRFTYQECLIIFHAIIGPDAQTSDLLSLFMTKDTVDHFELVGFFETCPGLNWDEKILLEAFNTLSGEFVLNSDFAIIHNNPIKKALDTYI